MCAVVSAYQMMTDPSPEPECWDRDQNILDQVHTYIETLVLEYHLAVHEREWNFCLEVMAQWLVHWTSSR